MDRSSRSAAAGSIAPPPPITAFRSHSGDHLDAAGSGSSGNAYTRGARARRRSRTALRVSRLRFWDSRSPNFRFFILALATLVPFGGHVIKYSLSSLQNEMLADPEFGLTHTKLGMFQSALSIPNLFMPLLGGMFLDHKGSAMGTLTCLALCLIGHLGFILACIGRSFFWAMLARILFGLGQGSTVVAQGRICATWFTGREIVFAIALTESTHNLANFVAFIYVVPVSNWFGGYIYALWAGLSFCLVSMIAGLLFFAVNRDAEPSMRQVKVCRDDQMGLEDDDEDEVQAEDENTKLVSGGGGATANRAYDSFAEADASRAADAGSGNGSPTISSPGNSSAMSSLSESDEVIPGVDARVYDVPPRARPLNPLRGLSLGFWILVILHMLYSNTFHLFAYISAAFIEDRFHTGVAKAGWLAGLANGVAIFLCPLAGIVMDHVGYKMYIQVVAGILTTTAYLLLLNAATSPIPSLVLLALCVSFTPTILKSSVPNLVLPAVFGCAYGVYQIGESLGSVLGNAMVGWLRDETLDWDTDIEIFAAMGATATVLTIVLIGLDRTAWIGLFTRSQAGHDGEAIVGRGSLNQSSFNTKVEYDRLKRSKDRFLQKERRWREEERVQQQERDVETTLTHVEDGHVFTPTNKMKQEQEAASRMV